MPRLGLIISEQNGAHSWEIFQNKDKTVVNLFSTDSLVATFSLLDSRGVLDLIARLVRSATDDKKYTVVTRPLNLYSAMGSISSVYLTNRKTNPNIEMELYSASRHYKAKLQFTKEQIISAALLLWKALATLGGIV